MAGKIKKLLQSIFLYRIYLLIVKHYRFWVQDKLYPRIYKKYASKPVDENKVVFFEVGSSKLTNSFAFLYDTLSREYDYELHCHFLLHTTVSKKEQRKRFKSFVKDIATAKYVFLNEATDLLSHVDLRKETVVTQLWHGCGAFKKFGLSTADLLFGATADYMKTHPYHKGYTHVTVSSEEVMWAYEEAMGYTRESGVVKPIGVSRTDIFFDEKQINDSFKSVYSLVPNAEGKKIILYAPTFRGHIAEAKAPDVLDIEMMKQALSDEYVLLIKHHPHVKNRPPVPENCRDFAFDVTNSLTIEELICTADICISDYSSLVYEYSLFEKPMIFLAYDLDEYFDWRGFYYDYYELAPGPVVITTEEITDFVKNIGEAFDKNRVVNFKQKFMSACDGHSTERIMNLVFGEALAKHRLAASKEDKKYHLIPSADDFYKN